MINKTVKKVGLVVVSLVFIVLAACTYIFIAQKRIADFLAKTEVTEANILIVEGWLPKFAIEIAKNEFNTKDYKLIVTTGLKSHDLDFCMIAMNGYLIFYPKFQSVINEKSGHHIIEILAHSKMGGKYCAHFNFFVNDSLIADFTADENERKYAVNWTGSLKDIDSLMIHFDNDYVDEGGDRNLYVKEIIIDNEIIIPYQFHSVYDIGLHDGKNRIVNNFESHAEKARNELITLGVDSSLIIAVKGKKTRFNRTLASALAVNRWQKSYDGKIDGINIITLGIHSRRTLLTYNRVLDKSLEIGIISLSEHGEPGFEELNFGDLLSELSSLIYYCIILIPYEFI